MGSSNSVNTMKKTSITTKIHVRSQSVKSIKLNSNINKISPINSANQTSRYYGTNTKRNSVGICGCNNIDSCDCCFLVHVTQQNTK